MKLTAPDGDTKMVRSGESWNRKKWHFLRNNRFQVGICDTVCFDPQYTTLNEIKSEKDICSLCWPFKNLAK